MVETLQKTASLGELEQIIRHRLSQSLPDLPDRLQITCGLRQDCLWVFVHGSEAIAPQSSQIFERIRALIAKDYPHHSQTLHLYFIIHGQPLLPESAGLVLRNWTSALRSPLYRQRLRSPHLRLSRLYLHRLHSRLQRQLPAKVQSLSLSTAGIGLGAVAVIFGLYALTRPCAIGSCSRLADVEQQANQASQSLSSAMTVADFREIQRQFQQASRQLAGIPPWSVHYAPARQQINSYHQQSQHLDRLIAALTLAEQAKTQNLNLSKFSLSEAQQRQKLWQEAIADLQSLPPQSPLYALALLKQKDFQSRLTQLQQQLQRETTAIAHLDGAKEAATLAQSLAQTAQSLADWQQVTVTWETAIQRLRQVPPNTTSYAASRQAIAEYLPQFVTADKRHQLEADAERYSQTAYQFATAAQKSQAQQQWSLAVSQWQQAIAQLQSIPAQSQQASTSQSQIASYRLALQQAEIQQRAANQRLALQRELQQICRDRTHICDYWLGDRLIRLTLTPSYLAQVWNTALQAKAQANVPTQIELLNHVSRLEQNLQLLSQRTGMRIEVYDAKGALMSNYEMQ